MAALALGLVGLLAGTNEGGGALHGKLALVTGGSKGIGRAIVDELVAEGATVIACARDTAPLQNAGPRVVPICADVSTTEGRARLLEAVESTGGVLDILVNNVGTNIRKATTEYSDEEFDCLMATNLHSAFHLSRQCFARWLRGSKGCIVNISSISGVTSDGTGVVYAMSKAALDMMTRYCAVEWGADGVRVNSVAPWFIKTALTEPILKGRFNDRVLARTPMRRVGTVAEVARVAVFLCTPGAGYVTGQVLCVDGGFTVNGNI